MHTLMNKHTLKEEIAFKVEMVKQTKKFARWFEIDVYALTHGLDNPAHWFTPEDRLYYEHLKKDVYNEIDYPKEWWLTK